jgi:curved DNA-binding protein CbpA
LALNANLNNVPKNLYETLGVKKDATPAELKRARRDRARQLHPDKEGGSEDEMRKVNHAFDVLFDPTRRQLYDATGQESQQPEEDRVRQLLFQGFIDALVKDAPNVVKGAQQFLESAKSQIEGQQVEGERALHALKGRRDKVTTKSPINAFHLIVDQQIVGIEQKLAGLGNDLETVNKALKELKAYKSSEKLVAEFKLSDSRRFGVDLGGSATTGSGW